MILMVRRTKSATLVGNETNGRVTKPPRGILEIGLGKRPNVQSDDPVQYSAGAALVVASVTCLIPARRATRFRAAAI